MIDARVIAPECTDAYNSNINSIFAFQCANILSLIVMLSEVELPLAEA